MAETIMDESLRFPDDICYGSTGGPGYNTDVVTVQSGYETRNINWTEARHTYNVAFGIRDKTYLDELVKFFHACKGKAYGFRYKDWNDYIGTNEKIGIGDDTTTQFQLVKNYTYGFQTVRTINKPVVGTTKIYIDTVEQTTGWTIDTTTGIITFTTAPALNEVITADFEFDVACRFDTDTLSINLEMYQHGSTDVPIVELRL